MAKFRGCPKLGIPAPCCGTLMCSSVPPHSCFELRTTAIDSVSIWKGISFINGTKQSCFCFDILSFRTLIH